MPIGNLTSQIFANIYLNEMDRFVVHTLRPDAYLRYGDDFIIVVPDRGKAEALRLRIIAFLRASLSLDINPKHDEVRKIRHGLHFLGVEIYPDGRRLDRRNRSRVFARASRGNAASYASLLLNHEKPSKLKLLYWHLQQADDSRDFL